jgi:hypothetical protein
MMFTNLAELVTTRFQSDDIGVPPAGRGSGFMEMD